MTAFRRGTFDDFKNDHRLTPIEPVTLSPGTVVSGQSYTNRTTRKPNYCGCCGRVADAGEWCSDCAKHVDPKKTFWDATYLAQHGVDCPYTEREGPRAA